VRESQSGSYLAVALCLHLALARSLSLTPRVRALACSLLFSVFVLSCARWFVFMSLTHHLSHSLSPSPPSFLHSFFLSSLSRAVCLSVSSSFHILALPHSLSHILFLVRCLSLSLALFLSSVNLISHARTLAHGPIMHLRTRTISTCIHALKNIFTHALKNRFTHPMDTCSTALQPIQKNSLAHTNAPRFTHSTQHQQVLSYNFRHDCSTCVTFPPVGHAAHGGGRFVSLCRAF